MPAFESELLNLYRQQPCRILPNALWKTLKMLASDQVGVAMLVERQRVVRLQAADPSRLLVYWDAFRRMPQLTAEADYELALLHEDYAAALPQLKRREPYYRMRHRSQVDPADLPPGFTFAPVDPLGEADVAAKLISHCYEDMKLAPAVVSGWADHPVYAPELWMWIIDTARDRPAALGIGELDRAVPEVSLEWIQVLPEYRRRGLGAALVAHLLGRGVEQANLITVSGRLNGHPGAQNLYRRAGFSGRDVWWVLRP